MINISVGYIAINYDREKDGKIQSYIDVVAHKIKASKFLFPDICKTPNVTCAYCDNFADCKIANSLYIMADDSNSYKRGLKIIIRSYLRADDKNIPHLKVFFIGQKETFIDMFNYIYPSIHMLNILTKVTEHADTKRTIPEIISCDNNIKRTAAILYKASNLEITFLSPTYIKNTEGMTLQNNKPVWSKKFSDIFEITLGKLRLLDPQFTEEILVPETTNETNELNWKMIKDSVLNKTLSGFVGKLNVTLKEPLTMEQATVLALAKYIGVGKNVLYGCGAINFIAK